jgi:predicted DNA-binding protein
MGGKKKLTIRLDGDTFQKARDLAAERSVPVSRFVAGEIERLVDEAEPYEVAKQAALTALQHGFNMGGGSLPAREELYDRGPDVR